MPEPLRARSRTSPLAYTSWISPHSTQTRWSCGRSAFEIVANAAATGLHDATAPERDQLVQRVVHVATESRARAPRRLENLVGGQCTCSPLSARRDTSLRGSGAIRCAGAPVEQRRADDLPAQYSLRSFLESF